MLTTGRGLGAAVLAVILALVAACGGSAPAAPSAWALAAKIPGCTAVKKFPWEPGLLPGQGTDPAAQDVMCNLPDGQQANIATFTSAAAKQKWLNFEAGQTGEWGDCCAAGPLWAADSGVRGSDADLRYIVSALGGSVMQVPSSTCQSQGGTVQGC